MVAAGEDIRVVEEELGVRCDKVSLLVRWGGLL